MHCYANLYKIEILSIDMKKGENNNNDFGIASVILGVIGAVLGILVLPIILSILGLIFGIIQYRRMKNAWAIWGIVLSILGILISIYIIVQVSNGASQIQQTMIACQTDPTAPGCADLLKLTGVQTP